MMRKKIISLLLVFILLLQVLPVKQVGYVLFSNQINEELPHGMDIGKETSKLPLLNDGLSHFSDAIHFLNCNSKPYCFAFYASDIPNNHSTEVPTPPPNI
jgi:hypothetical protein